MSGTTIDAYCSDNDLSLTERLELMREVCEVVEHAHRNLVVHRDL
ncbi:MAG: serine/threonine protein kinase, partial [Gemmatimonadetes bacterium]|nr:serine/threonine protein kinase [Gemmatimonadota bacterium]NIW63505.1 serine/threonine protein kinase [Gemmatimonadota bacterium]NIX41657.1 serine/threonine protein kinase [Gemmatimonadota bacterium]